MPTRKADNVDKVLLVTMIKSALQAAGEAGFEDTAFALAHAEETEAALLAYVKTLAVAQVA